MKLRNKLIPLASIAATTSLLVPMLSTSCSKNVSMVDITSPYAPTIAKAEALGTEEDPATLEKAYNLYMNHVMANPDILRQDIWYYEAQKLPSRIEKIEYLDAEGYTTAEKTCSVTNVTANISINNVEVKKQTVIIEGEETEFYSISLDIGYEYEFTATSLSTEPRYQVTNKFNFNAKYNDVPLYMYSDTNRNWHVSMNLLDDGIDAYLSQLPGWYVQYSADESIKYVVESNGTTQTSYDGASKSDTITRRSQIYALQEDSDSLYGALADMYLNYIPYHLQDVWAPAPFIAFKNSLNLSAAYDDYAISKKGDGHLNVFELSDEAKALTDKAKYVYVDITDGESGSGKLQMEGTVFLGTMNSTSSEKTLTSVQFGMQSSYDPATVSGSDIYLDYLYGVSRAEITDQESFIGTISANNYWFTVTWVDEDYNELRSESFTMPEDVTVTINVGPEVFEYLDWATFTNFTNIYYDSIQSGEKTVEEAEKDLLSNLNLTKLEDAIGLERTLKINGLDHTVRCIGVNHDTLVNPAGDQTTALFTFQSTTLLSSEEARDKYDIGLALTAALAPGLTNVGLYKNLNGEDDTAEWYNNIAETLSNKSTLLQMIANENTGTPAVFNNLKQVKKQAAAYDNDTSKYVVKTDLTPKLFILTPNEMDCQDKVQERIEKEAEGRTVQEIVAGTPYAYYKNSWSSTKMDIRDVEDNKNVLLINSPITIENQYATYNAIDWYDNKFGSNTDARAFSFAFCI